MTKKIFELVVGDSVAVCGRRAFRDTMYIGTVTKITKTRQITVEYLVNGVLKTKRFGSDGYEYGNTSCHRSFLDADIARREQEYAINEARVNVQRIWNTFHHGRLEQYFKLDEAKASVARVEAMLAEAKLAIADLENKVNAIPDSN